jgi:hypothetical protein
MNSQVLKRENDWRDCNEGDDDEHDPRPRIAEIERVPDADALLHKQRWVLAVNVKNASLPVGSGVRSSRRASIGTSRDSTANNATGARINKISRGAS